MLKIENLTKIYSRGEKQVVALNNISFTLDNKGFVFITGKSGCGKSTLLNMIGGLDNITSGDIVCDGNRLSEFKNSDFDKYRNTYLGFVFQDYCLIDDLNVYQNIEIALDLKGENYSNEEKDLKIEEVLTSVDLDLKIKNRYVKELSGGQKQRIAIARALIKNPKLILADEPTGNLDSKTSERILKTLKNLSKDRLVVIVSHNLDDAKKYADRIIELADGEVKSDSSRDEEEAESLTFKKGVLTLPHSTTLTKSQLKEINEKLENNNIKKIRQHGNGFKKTQENFVEGPKVDIEPKKMSKSSNFRLSWHFIKKRILASLVTTIVVTALIFVLGMCQFFIQFEEAKTVYSVMKENGETDLLIYNGYYNEDGEIESGKAIEVKDEDIQELIDAGYSGNIYKIYNNMLGINSHEFRSEKITSPYHLFKGAYIEESLGTLVCDEEFLIRQFGINGELDVLAGVINQNGGSQYKEEGVIVTDYWADSLINLQRRKYSNYSSIVGKYYRGTYINGIINTGYKEKYADIFKFLQDLAIGIDRSGERDFFKERLSAFMADVQKKYGLAYSTAPNYQTTLNYHQEIEAALSYAKIGYGDRIQDIKPTIYAYNSNNPLFDISGNEIVTRYDMFNAHFGSILGVTYTEENLDTFVPVTITLYKTDGTEENNIIYSIDLTIKSIFGKDVFDGASSDSCYIWMKNPEIYEMIHEASIHSFGIYLEDGSQLNKIYEIIENKPYTIQSRVYKSISQVGDIVKIFNDLFWLILIAIGGISIILLVSYAYGNIRKRYYEIGVLKAIGTTTKSVGFIFSLQTMYVGFAISVLSTIMLLTLSAPINNMLASELINFINNSNITQLSIINVNAPTLIINVVVVLLVTVMSCLIPFIKLNRIKPKNIIANDE